MSIVGNPATQALAEQVARDQAPRRVQFAPGSPEWWRDLLLSQLLSRRPQILQYADYYEGRHRLAFATQKFRDAFGNLFAAFADNWCDLVVDASVERLGVEGFRFGGSEKPADAKAWDIWQANGLDAEADLAHSTAVTTGEAYLLVTPGDDGPLIQVEHPTCAIVAVDPARPRKRLAGLRLWVDMPSGLETTVLYLPEEVHWWTRPLPPSTAYGPGGITTPQQQPGNPLPWQGVPDQTGRNPLGVVPLIPMVNNPRLTDRRGRSDIARVIPIQDAINKLVTDMLVASEFCAFPQRYAIGVETPALDPEGKPPPTFLAALDRIWTVSAPDVRFGEFTASDLSNYVRGIESLVQHVAAQTRTPPHYLLGSSGNFPSGESLKATETGLVAKVRRKQLWFSEGWEEAVRLAFQIQGDSRASTLDAETIWRDPESRSEGERVDALTKMATLGVPNEALWEAWGATPQQVTQWKAQAAQAKAEAQAKADAIAAGAQPPVTGGGVPGQQVPQPAPQPPVGTPAA